jgi:tetratricopeptide (TPR) repeat protein
MATLTETAGAPLERFPETARRIAGTTGERRRFGARLSHRTVLVRLDARAWRVLAAVLLLAGAAGIGKAIVEPAIAEHLASRASTESDLRRALAWDPDDPELHLRLARVLAGSFGGDLDAARRHLDTALRLRPTHAGTWLELALLADRRGEAAPAKVALETALRLDPHNVDLRWDAALVLLRRYEPDAAIEHFRYVIAVDPRRRDAAFQLASALVPPGASATALMPAEPLALTGLLAGAIGRGDVALAGAAWERRAPLAPPVPDGLLRRYLDLLLREGQGAAARRLWLAMVSGAQANPNGDVIWNGGFEADRLAGWGLDWQIRRVWGVDVTLDRFNAAQGKQSLRLTFNSYPTLDFAGVVQAVPVQPGRQYVLRAKVRALDFSTRSGIKLEVASLDDERLAETRDVSGTTPDWVVLEARLRVPSDATLVQVRVRREKALEPEGNLGGKVWLDDVSLVPLAPVAATAASRAGGRS